MRRFSVRNLGFLLLIGVAGWLAAAAQAAETSILQEVLRRGTVRIAVNTGNEPRQFVDEKGELQGYDIDIANHMAKQLGVTAEFIRTDVAGRVAMLQSRKADVTIATFTPNLERLKTVGFTDPYTTDVLTLMQQCGIDPDPLLTELRDHLSPTDLESLRKITDEIRQRIARFGKEFQ